MRVVLISVLGNHVLEVCDRSNLPLLRLEEDLLELFDLFSLRGEVLHVSTVQVLGITLLFNILHVRVVP